MKYIVLDNGKPAKIHNQNADWNNNEFDTAKEACEYLANWLGDWCPEDKEFELMLQGQAYDYSGEGDIVEIKIKE